MEGPADGGGDIRGLLGKVIPLGEEVEAALQVPVEEVWLVEGDVELLLQRAGGNPQPEVFAAATTRSAPTSLPSKTDTLLERILGSMTRFHAKM